MRALVILLTAAGCATTSTTTEKAAPSPFPTRDALEKIATTPAPTKLAGHAGLEADGWTLAGPLPDVIEPMQYSDGSPWQAMLEEVAAKRPGQVAMPASMRCVAQENGRFYLAKRELPAQRLARFIAARCGAYDGDVAVFPLTTQVPPGVSAERVAEHYRPQIVENLEKALARGTMVAGIWYGQKDDQALVMISLANRRANLASLALVPAADGNVVVQGELLEPTVMLQAVFNRGHFGFGRCTVDAAVLLPHFRVVCPVDAADAASWIEIAAFPEGRILGHVVASLLVFPSGTAQSIYHDAGYVSRADPAGADPRAQLLALLNEVRRGAGLAEVTLSPRQSVIAERVAPHYFAALTGAEPELTADQIVLGLRAGWEIEGNVLSGEFTSGALLRTNDLGRLLDAVLDRPSGREALLGARSRFVAIGPLLVPAEQMIAMVATSYTLLENPNHDADAQRALGRLTKACMDHGFRVPRKLEELVPIAQDAAARVTNGQSTPRQALQRMLERAVARMPGVGFHGWELEVGSIDDVQLPSELVRYPIGGVAIGVGHYRPPSSPWSRLVVFVVVAAAGSNGMQSVARDARRF